MAYLKSCPEKKIEEKKKERKESVVLSSSPNRVNMRPVHRRPAGVNETNKNGLYLMGGVKDLRDMVCTADYTDPRHPAQKLQAMQRLGTGTFSLSRCHHLLYFKI